MVVDVRSHPGARVGRVAVDISVIVRDGGSQPETQHAGHQRLVEHGAHVVVRAAVLGHGQRCGRLAAELGQVDRVGPKADDAALGAGAVQRALRPAQHLDLVDVQEIRLGLAHVVGAPIPRRDRHVVEIDADRGCARGRADAADLERIAARIPVAREGEIGNDPRQVLGIAEMLLVELSRADDADADGHVAQVLLDLLRRDGDLGYLVGVLGPSRRRVARRESGHDEKRQATSARHFLLSTLAKPIAGRAGSSAIMSLTN